MYNCKIKDYGNGQVQTRLYTHLVYTGKKKKPEFETKEYLENPFENDSPVQVVKDFDEFEQKHERSIYNSCKRAKNKVYDISRSNQWDWFVTLTLNSENVNRFDYEECIKKVSQWLWNMRKRCATDLKYLIVPEQHKDGAFHFHGLFKNAQGLEFTDSGRKDSKGRKIYNIGKYSLGWTTATPVGVQEAVTKYITKYTTKNLAESIFGKKKYFASRNLNMPKESTEILDREELSLFHQELVEDAVFFKESEYEINRKSRKIFYYEHVKEIEK